MNQEDKRDQRSWWWVLPAAAGLALVMTAILLWSPGPGVYATPEQTATSVAATATAAAAPTATYTPTATATPNPDCVLNVSKNDNLTSRVPEDGQISYTITITNDGSSGSGYCTDLTVTDTIPTDTDCSDATDDGTMDFSISGCDASGDVVWHTHDNLDTGDEVVLTMVVDLTSGANEGDTITNEACAVSSNDVGGDCDNEQTRVGAPATATPTSTATPAPTATTRPPATVAPPPVVPPPSGGQAPVLIAPASGTGTAAGGSGGSQALALALGLAGACLLLVSGVTFARRPR